MCGRDRIRHNDSDDNNKRNVARQSTWPRPHHSMMHDNLTSNNDRPTASLLSVTNSFSHLYGGNALRAHPWVERFYNNNHASKTGEANITVGPK